MTRFFRLTANILGPGVPALVPLELRFGIFWAVGYIAGHKKLSDQDPQQLRSSRNSESGFRGFGYPLPEFLQCSRPLTGLCLSRAASKLRPSKPVV